eukprot:gnl/MRDRNA2_/MRDRNA2_88452_c0_seq1.p1 gnl/MRDRNA2_/MRDRNA2_88452_c0~~gnl/MRDRNA2_/MRDRNA2_88452_c0_seq1.p1  ORF type:complete len:211 (+),score=55.76 gnl/MRDRNA2_/MRDRNA2_88452_c0_seq1:66-698(+)
MGQSNKEEEESEWDKALKKFLDEADEKFCGFCSLQLVDQDGYSRKTKGSNIEAPIQMVKGDGGSLKMVAEFSNNNPLFYVEVPNQDEIFMFGQIWYGSGSWGRTSQIMNFIPKECKKLHSQMEKEGKAAFTVDAEVPFITDAPSRLLKTTFETVEQRFITKVCRVTVEVPVEVWKEWKSYRSRMFQSWKSWSGKDENEKKKKKDDKKDKK